MSNANVTDLVDQVRHARSILSQRTEEINMAAWHYREAVRELRDEVGAEQAGRLLGISRQQVYRLTRNSKTGSSEDARGPN